MNYKSEQSQICNSIDSEPSVQEIKTITIKCNPYLRIIKHNLMESDSFESNRSIFNSEIDCKHNIESQSNISTANTINQKSQKKHRLINKGSLQSYPALRKRIQSFRIDEDIQSQDDEEESLPQNLLEVDLQFREDAIVSVQKILQSKKKIN